MEAVAAAWAGFVREGLAPAGGLTVAEAQAAVAAARSGVLAATRGTAAAAAAAANGAVDNNNVSAAGGLAAQTRLAAAEEAAWAAQVAELWLVVGWGFVLMMATYWAYGLSLLVVDVSHKPDWLYARRHQPHRPYTLGGTPYNPAFTQLLRNVLINQFFVIIPGLAALQLGLRPLGLGIQVSAELPSLVRVLAEAAIGVLAVEVCFYLSHRWLHTPFMYKNVHKVHHGYKAPHALAAIYAHPVEALLGNTLAVMGPAFFFRFHLFSWYMGMILGWIATCNGHSGYDLPWASKVSGFRTFHDHHHQYFAQNYGNMGLMDRFFRTDTSWRRRHGLAGGDDAMTASDRAARKAAMDDGAPTDNEHDDNTSTTTKNTGGSTSPRVRRRQA